MLFLNKINDEIQFLEGDKIKKRSICDRHIKTSQKRLCKNHT